MIKVFEKADIEVETNEFSTIHRLPSREDNCKAIIMKFKTRDVRNEVIRKKKPMRENEDFKAAFPNVFMVEHLTPLRSKVAYMLRHDPNIEKTFTIDGRIKVLKVGHATDAKPHSINSLLELKKIGWTDEKIEELILGQ